MRKLCIFTLIFMCAWSSGQAQVVEFSNEATDTTVINRLLIDGLRETKQMRVGDRMVYFGRHMLDIPYVNGTLDVGESEIVRVNMSGLDCTTFVETALALTITVGEGRSSWRDFAYNLERVRYRGGRADDYGSRLHYMSDWVMDNQHRGIISEVTGNLASSRFVVKTIDFMTRHRELYAQLADSVNYERMRNVELGYRSHRFPIIKSSVMSQKANLDAIMSGDVLLFVTSKEGLDVQHVAIAIKDGAGINLLHASSAEGRVVVDKQSLVDYLRRNRSITGVRIIRVNN